MKCQSIYKKTSQDYMRTMLFTLFVKSNQSPLLNEYFVELICVPSVFQVLRRNERVDFHEFSEYYFQKMTLVQFTFTWS